LSDPLPAVQNAGNPVARDLRVAVELVRILAAGGHRPIVVSSGVWKIDAHNLLVFLVGDALTTCLYCMIN